MTCAPELPDVTPDAEAIERAERAGIDPRRPYRCQQYPSGALLFTQEIAPPSDRPESQVRELRVAIRPLMGPQSLANPLRFPHGGGK